MQNTAQTGPDAPIDVTPLLDDPYAAYAALREAGPVHRITGADGSPAWLVTRYEDVRSALADPRLSLDRRHAGPGGYRGFALPPALDANLLNMDPPDHTRVRRLVVKAFTPGRVETLRAPVRRVADELLDAMAERGRADLIADYAGPLPITVICDLLGIPQRDRRDFLAWSDALITPDPSRPEGMKQAIGAMLEFYTGLIAAKRAEPGDDLLSDLIAVRDDAPAADGSDRLTEDELTSLAFLILFAGYENTVHLIGNAVLALLDHPDLLRQLQQNPAELPAAVEEFLRYDGPGPLAIRRFPTQDVEIGGVRIPAGDSVLLAIASANRDPARFPAPDALDRGRDLSGHLAMGHGIHYCLGAPLARMEAVTALEALLGRFPELRLDVPRGELRHRRTLRSRGLISLPVAWETASEQVFEA
ncbi:cytochrome P450 [Streptomyces sp. 2333.5]|uniref:cytochrome P450 family protein n=1 Tax=unclassified Streptomyces TaxID=2593676 RepID=UPI00089BC598|nr:MULTISPECIES: cytochrome P450 [unclassified Streptomyces]PJJ05695.1 cytochrome P450 [Streptomyces sp. 2333.5]SEE82195.1 Cytochrome P450 [Streptomyces sp. 2314.4]SEF02692.1 Cytochrome P450 [Streptomyces sp. 2112.2]